MPNQEQVKKNHTKRRDADRPTTFPEPLPHSPALEVSSDAGKVRAEINRVLGEAALQ